MVDRIMKPDMTLENEAQNKKFTADRTSVHKQAHVGTFYLQQKSPAKNYTGTRDFRSSRYNAGAFNQRDQAGATALAGKTAPQSSYSQASRAVNAKEVSDQNKNQAPREYAGKRPFLDKGKSQKSLNRKNRPMTIDEVRELLNKNK